MTVTACGGAIPLGEDGVRWRSGGELVTECWVPVFEAIRSHESVFELVKEWRGKRVRVLCRARALNPA
jgi:hypothetical protein